MGFGLFRPRRPSYTFATQIGRQRSESYRYATRRDPDEAEQQPKEDYIENVLSKVHKESYVKATRGISDEDENQVELTRLTENHLTVIEEGPANDALCESQNHINQKVASQNSCETTSTSRQASVDTLDSKSRYSVDSRPRLSLDSKSRVSLDSKMRLTAVAGTPTGEDPPAPPSVTVSKSCWPDCFGNKNLIILCVGFIFIFSPFRGVQNLQSSLNAENQLGIIAMCCVHVTMVVTCLLAPLWTNIFTAKWTLALGALCFLLWFGANFYPTFYTLIPAALVAGFGNGLLWTAESAYLLKLAFDSACQRKDTLEPKMFRFHGIFLAGFQTTHIWGNLLSSLLIGHRTTAVTKQVQMELLAQAQMFNMTVEQFKTLTSEPPSQCGVLYQCQVAVDYIPFFPGKPYGQW
jgi:hypothetical protein